MDLLSHRLTALRHGRWSVSSGSSAVLSAFLTHVMYARCGCPARMHPHVCWRLTRARSTSAASEHFLLTQVASAGLIAPDASSTPTAPACSKLMYPPDLSLAGRQTSQSDILRSGAPEDCQGGLNAIAHAESAGAPAVSGHVASRTAANHPRTIRTPAATRREQMAAGTPDVP